MPRFARSCVSKLKRETLPLPCSQERTHHSGHTSHYHLLQGTRGCAMVRLMSRFANALANANARRSPCLARRSVKPTANARRSIVLAYVPLHYLEAAKDTTVKWNTTGLEEYREGLLQCPGSWPGSLQSRSACGYIHAMRPQ